MKEILRILVVFIMAITMNSHICENDKRCNFYFKFVFKKIIS